MLEIQNHKTKNHSERETQSHHDARTQKQGRRDKEQGHWVKEQGHKERQKKVKKDKLRVWPR